MVIELKIKKKYFDAILQLKKPFELRHKEIPKGSIVKLTCIENGRYIIFKSGECRKLEKLEYYDNEIGYNCDVSFLPSVCQDHLWFTKKSCYLTDCYDETCNNDNEWDWYDNFCWDYINEKQTYLIEIAEILEVN